MAVQALAAYWADAPQTVPVLEHLAFGKTSSNGEGPFPARTSVPRRPRHCPAYARATRKPPPS